MNKKATIFIVILIGILLMVSQVEASEVREYDELITYLAINPDNPGAQVKLNDLAYHILGTVDMEKLRVVIEQKRSGVQPIVVNEMCTQNYCTGR